MPEHARTARLALSGELDVTNADAIRAEIDGVTDARPGTAVSLDLAAVTFVDSSALGALVGALRHARKQGGDVVVTGLTPSVAKIFRVTGLDKVFEVGADERTR